MQGAIKTDFILSAEIMTIALSSIESDHFVTEAVALAAVGLAITALVYGAVALLVKADDLGLTLTRIGRLEATRARLWVGRTTRLRGRTVRWSSLCPSP